MGPLRRPQSVCLSEARRGAALHSQAGQTTFLPALKPGLAVDTITQQEERCTNANTLYCASNVSDKITNKVQVVHIVMPKYSSLSWDIYFFIISCIVLRRKISLREVRGEIHCHGS